LLWVLDNYKVYVQLTGDLLWVLDNL